MAGTLEGENTVAVFELAVESCLRQRRFFYSRKYFALGSNTEREDEEYVPTEIRNREQQDSRVI